MLDCTLKYHFKGMKLIFCPLTRLKPLYDLTVTVDVEYLTMASQIKVMLVRSFLHCFFKFHLL